MRMLLCLCALAVATVAFGAGKTHAISFGRWQLVKVDIGGNTETVDLRVRTLMVDGKVKEYTVGQPHDVTERVFVVARAFRLNDVLPDEMQSRWIWQRGGWIQVDRWSGRITSLKLVNFDPQLSVGSWYRDYIAYCGASEDGAHIYAIVMQLGVRKPILRKEFEGPAKPSGGDSLCRSPAWHHKPIRVAFNISNGQSLTSTVQGRAAEITATDEDDSE